MELSTYLENKISDFNFAKRKVVEEYNIPTNSELYQHIQNLKFDPNLDEFGQVYDKVMNYMRNGTPFWNTSPEQRMKMKKKANKVTDEQIKDLIRDIDVKLNSDEGRMLFQKLKSHKYDPKYKSVFSGETLDTNLWDQLYDLSTGYAKYGELVEQHESKRKRRRSTSPPRSRKTRRRHESDSKTSPHKSCKEKSQSECKSSNTCKWIEYTNKNGTHVRYCRKSPSNKVKRTQKRKQSSCKGKPKSECNSSNTCKWIEYTTKKGTHVRYCRRSPNKRNSPRKRQRV